MRYMQLIHASHTTVIFFSILCFYCTRNPIHIIFRKDVLTVYCTREYTCSATHLHNTQQHRYKYTCTACYTILLWMLIHTGLCNIGKVHI